MMDLAAHPRIENQAGILAGRARRQPCLHLLLAVSPQSLEKWGMLFSSALFDSFVVSGKRFEDILAGSTRHEPRWILRRAAY
jgi:hypothetical protein